MTTFSRSLTPEEVPAEWREYLDFNNQEVQEQQTVIWVTCPVCGRGRWVPACQIRNRSYHSLRCRYCNSYVRYLKPEDIAEEWREYFDFDRQKLLGNKPRKLHVWKTCPDCNAEGWKLVCRARREATPRCSPCSHRHTRTQKAIEGGGKYTDNNGYIRLYWSTLPPGDRLLARDMVTTNRPVLEHRLVMARHLGRPLSPKEQVHHINSIRDDNRLENLRLLTIQNHPSGHGDFYYQKWQEALARIAELEAQLGAAQS